MSARIISLFLLTATLLPAQLSAEPLKVVTTLSTYAALVRTIGGELVSVTSIASPKFNPHFIEPRPSDVLRLKRADLFVHSGLDLEAWRGPLLNAAGRSEFRPGSAGELDLSVGVSLLEIPTQPLSRANGDIHLHGNPHYWLSPDNGAIMSRSIATKLGEVDPPNRPIYEKNFASFIQLLNTHIAQWNEMLAPYRGKEVIGYHNEWLYLVSYMGLTTKRYIEPKPGIPPSPQHIEQLTAYIREHDVKVILQASFSPRDAGEALAERTGATVVLAAQSVDEIEGTGDYISLINYDVTSIIEALKGRV